MAGGPSNYRTVVLQDESLRNLQGFTQIPNVVLKHPKISFGAKVAYGVLLSYAWSEDFCFPAQERLAKDLNCSVRQVQRLLTELKEHGFITWKQQGLNRPNIYYLLPISRWHRPSTANPDTTNPSSPDTTHRSRQEATNPSPKQDSRKNTHTIVNRSDNDHRDPLRDRPSTGRKTVAISDRVLRTRYRLSDNQIGRVHWLVEKQVDTLGAVDRNHAHYVKRAAEAVRDDNDHVLERMLGEFKQAAGEITVSTRPGYFHAMYTDALTQRTVQRVGRQLVEPAEADDDRNRMITDAENLGIDVPEFIRHADTSAVRQWWAALMDGKAAA